MGRSQTGEEAWRRFGIVDPRQNGDIVRLTAEELKRKMADKEAAQAGPRREPLARRTDP